jgi:hypothetical protein
MSHTEDFNVLLAKVSDAADSRNIPLIQELLKDTKKEHGLYQPLKEQAALIAAAEAHIKTEQTQKDAALASTEHIIKSWFVNAVNEWGADQGRILVLSDQAMYRVKMAADGTVEHYTCVELRQIVRVEYGKYKAAQKSLTTFLWKKELEQQHAFRVFTSFRDGSRSVNDVMQEKFGSGAPSEFFRDYRCYNVDEEPWREEPFTEELAAAFIVAMKLACLPNGKIIAVTSGLEKAVPGGFGTVLYNSLGLGGKK